MRIQFPKFVQFASLYLAFFAVISYLYLTDITPFWAYYGYKEVVDLGRLALSFAMLVLWAMVFKPKSIVSDMIILFSTFLYFIPSLVIYSLGGGSNYLLFVILMSLMVIFSVSRIKLRRMTMHAVTKKTIFTIILVCVAISMAVQVAFGGLSTFNLNILNVYEFRSEAASNIPTIFGYIISPTGKILIPMGFVLSAYFKNLRMAIIFSVITVLYFGISQHKSILFAPFLVYFLYLAILKYGGIRSIMIFFTAVMGLLMLNHIAYSLFSADSGASLISSFVLRRTLFAPALLDGFYIDFFSQNAKYYWSTSSITFGSINAQYDLNAPFLIGEVYFGNSSTAANSGIVASGFANAGIGGVLIYSIIFGLILSIFDSHGRKVGYNFVFAISLVVSISIITTTDLVTSILTHGVLVLILILSIFPEREKNKNNIMLKRKINLSRPHLKEIFQ